MYELHLYWTLVTEIKYQIQNVLLTL